MKTWTLEKIWRNHGFKFKTLPAFKGFDEILATLEHPIEDDSVFAEGEQLFELVVGNLEVKAEYYYIDNSYVSVYPTVYRRLSLVTEDYEVLKQCEEPLEFYPGITLDDIEKQLFGHLYGFENQLQYN